jgi:hypothetical protein
MMKTIPLTILAAVLFGGGQLNAAIIASSDFEDNSLGAIAGQTGGTGWTGSWGSADGATVGTTWSDVVVPEPSSALLGGLGFLLLLRRRR